MKIDQLPDYINGVRILHGDGKYRVVLDRTRIVLEWQDTDAAGSVRWLHIDSWDRTNTHAQSCHADIAMTCILRNYDMMVEELVKTDQAERLESD